MIGRYLLNVSDKFGERAGNLLKSRRRFDSLGRKRTFPVVGAAAHAQAKSGPINFVHALHILCQPRSHADAEDQDAARQRVERACMPNARAARQPAPRHVDGIARSHPQRLIDHQKPIHE